MFISSLTLENSIQIGSYMTHDNNDDDGHKGSFSSTPILVLFAKKYIYYIKY